MIDFDLLEERTQEAKAIAWDTCHKIYLLMDDAQVEKMRGYGYDPLITYEEMSSDDMYRTVVDWFEQSCGLRFVEAVSSVAEGEDENLGFETIIGQGEDEDDDEDDYEEDEYDDEDEDED